MTSDHAALICSSWRCRSLYPQPESARAAKVAARIPAKDPKSLRMMFFSVGCRVLWATQFEGRSLKVSRGMSDWGLSAGLQGACVQYAAQGRPREAQIFPRLRF